MVGPPNPRYTERTTSPMLSPSYMQPSGANQSFSHFTPYIPEKSTSVTESVEDATSTPMAEDATSATAGDTAPAMSRGAAPAMSTKDATEATTGDAAPAMSAEDATSATAGGPPPSNVGRGYHLSNGRRRRPSKCRPMTPPQQWPREAPRHNRLRHHPNTVSQGCPFSNGRNTTSGEALPAKL